MNRTILAAVGVFGASGLLLVDSAVKGTALLVLAGVAALVLRRDSAATRHLVWMLAIVALLVVPVLSATLPRWRVLPEWAGVSSEPAVVDTRTPPTATPAEGAVDLPQNPDPVELVRPSATVHRPAARLPEPPPASVRAEIVLEPAARSWNPIDALPLVWAIGFGVLILRLMAARLMLWNSERRGTVIWTSTRPAEANGDPIVTALAAACLQLGIRRPVTLLNHPDKTIPVVWGILRCRLLLPAAARDWSGEHLRSVLLHELAHVKRRDTLAQLLTQIACALHWFNPLVWLAAWRLGVERERACDDLVLASGVRPSAYAGHLLEVATALSPARWAQSCGLAMARKSSLEGRLAAVLSRNLNRRGVSVAVGAVALAIAAGVAVPVAMLRAADERPGAPVKQQEPPKPKDGATLQPGTEQRLQWGEPVNGLRAALVRPAALGEPEAREIFDLRIVVQNVSDAAVRFNTTSAEPKNPRLLIRKDGRPLAAFTGERPTPVDVTLKPREFAVLRIFPNTLEGDSVTRDDPKLTFSVDLNIDKAPAGAWTGKLVTAEMTAAYSGHGLLPKDKDARALFQIWNAGARRDGKIPGALVGLLAESVKTFTKNNPTWETTPQLSKMLPRFDATRDWSATEALALLDELAALQATPIGMAVGNEVERTIRTGMPLPRDLADAPWGEALPNGLRTAWLLEPPAAQYPLNTPLKSRVLIHNAGNDTVVFRTRTWHQGGHKAGDAKGAEINMNSVEWTTIGQLLPFRLGPGEFVEVNAAGIGVGARNNDNEEDWRNTRVGSWVEAKAGDDVTFTPQPLPLSDWNEEAAPRGEPRWWLDFITARLRRTLPLPEGAEERKLLLYRAAMDLFGTPVGAEENAAIVAAKGQDDLDALANRLAHRPGLTPFTGSLQSGPTKFRVLPPDPDAAKKPRTASNPGRYTVAENVVLAVTRRPVGERIVNEATLQFFNPDPKAEAPGKPVALKLPDGYNTWAAAWVRGGKVLWVQQKAGVRSYDFTDPARVKETALDGPGDLERVPKPVLDALRATLDVPGAPSAPKPAGPPAATPR